MTAQRSGPIRVFLVDEHRFILWALEKLIQSGKTAMEVVGSMTNCAEALALVDKADPDVILLDIDLSEENGLDAIPLFMARSPARILVLTGLRDKSVHEQAVMAGARGVVEKVASVETILTAIEKVHEGQLWLDRGTVGRIFVESSHQHAARVADPDQQKISTLTDRERKVIAVTSSHPRGTARAIAEILHVSEHTLRNHLTAIYRKLDVTNRLELFIYAQRFGLDKFPP